MDSELVWAEVDLKAISHNIRELRRITNPKARFMAVVKANAYGHGLVQVARLMEMLGADILGVAVLEEGMLLREQGIRSPILVLGGILLFLIIISLIYLDYDPIVGILSAYKHRDFTLVQRVLTQSRVVIFYLGLLLWPHPSRLNLDHDFALSYSLTDPVTTLISMAFITALIALAIAIAAALIKADMFNAMLLVVFALYLNQGVAVLHSVFHARQLNCVWLFLVYLFMFFVPHIVVVLALAGLADTWIDFRRRLSPA